LCTEKLSPICLVVFLLSSTVMLVAPISAGKPAPYGGGAIWVEPDYVNGEKIGLGLTFVVQVWINISETAGYPEHLGLYGFAYWLGWNDTLLELESRANVCPSDGFWEEGSEVFQDILEDTDANGKNDTHKYAVTALGMECTGFVGYMMVANYTFRIMYEPVPPETDMSCELVLSEVSFVDFNGGSISPISVHGGFYIFLSLWYHRWFGDFDLDGDVDIFDIRKVAKAYGSVAVDDPETPWDETQYWDPVFDVAPEGGDGKIDIFDLRRAARHYGEHV